MIADRTRLSAPGEETPNPSVVGRIKGVGNLCLVKLGCAVVARHVPITFFEIHLARTGRTCGVVA